MNYKDNYQLWLNSQWIDEEDKIALQNLTDEKDIEDRFYKELEFGTGGLRGIMGLGSNRMNKYNIRKASNGFARFLINKWGIQVSRGVAIAYDTRNNSKDYATEAALAFAANGVPVYLFNMYSATPLLSFAVRYLGCVGGVVVTASHNPKEYNGYKAYDENGCQLLEDDANSVISYVRSINLGDALTTTVDKAVYTGMLKYIGENVLNAYSKAVRASIPNPDIAGNAKLKVAYTALHGSGDISVRRVLKDAGFLNLTSVAAQGIPDGNFPTVDSPNPGNEPSMKMAIELGEEIGADIVVGSDPDADRTGVAIMHNGKLQFLDGNSIGALLLYYLATVRDIKDGSYFATTIVSGELASDIAKDKGIAVFKVLTGFKYIGEIMTKYQRDPSMSYFFGCEESYGFLGGDYVRDKCSAFAILALCSAAVFFKKKGQTLGDVMDEIHEKYGFYLNSLDNYRFEGKSGAERIETISEHLRKLGTKLLPNIIELKDYSQGIDGLPKSNVLKYFFADGSWMAIRPSGTEPLMKVYYSTKGMDIKEAEANYTLRKNEIDKLMN